MAGVEAGHTYRNQWYWGGEAALRANGDKLELRSVPASEWAEVENAAKEFWDEVAQKARFTKRSSASSANTTRSSTVPACPTTSSKPAQRHGAPFPKALRSFQGEHT